jgi:superfamily I DNA and/or RNA helicase
MAETVRIATGRAALLGEWRTNIVDAEQQLQRELVRYADVVAATCIGTATTKLLADLKFDLAIVDEAGQISTPDLLVPLVRAKRGVLVGDHRQLPPFLDDDVRKWSDGLTEMPSDVVKEIGDLLRMSAFERLYAAAPPDNAVMLAVQRRMPETLGRFVSRQFYDGILRTDHPGGHRDPIFRDAFAMVDTGDQPRSTRAERPFRNSEDGNRQGYVNEWEAQLVAALIPVYLRSYSDWAVIVPYRAQADRIIKLLGDVLGDAGAVADNVGTVDAFQGGERDLIVYGFTRSNAQGDIGFLRELRRLNVAISRAKRQLVLIGDLETLCAAKDRPFKEHMIALRSHLKTFGDLRRSGDVHTRLKSRAEDE